MQICFCSFPCSEEELKNDRPVGVLEQAFQSNHTNLSGLFGLDISPPPHHTELVLGFFMLIIDYHIELFSMAIINFL